jgi:hypothetical protein
MVSSLQGVKHLILTQQKNKSEIELFFENFKDKSYKIESDAMGNILKIITEDDKIITWFKEKGFNES